MKKNGFTLVELLAVVIILALIAAFALPAVLNQFSNYQENLDEDKRKLIVEAARVHLNENSGQYLEAKTYCVELQVLVNDGSLNKNFLDKSKFNDQYIVKIVYNSKKYTIDVVAKSACTPT